jgi:hypothetical protein
MASVLFGERMNQQALSIAEGPGVDGIKHYTECRRKTRCGEYQEVRDSLECFAQQLYHLTMNSNIGQIDEHTNLADSVSQLKTLSTKPCRFLHEINGGFDPPQCEDDVKESLLGCAHSGNKILKEAISHLETLGIISSEEAASHHKFLYEEDMNVLRLDVQAWREYEEGFGIEDDTIEDHKKLIARKNELRQKLLAIAESALS